MKIAKYLILADGHGHGHEHVHIFDGKLIHKDVADKLGGKPVSAGFVIVNKSGRIFCDGGSVSLGILESREQDKEIIKKFLGMKGE